MFLNRKSVLKRWMKVAGDKKGSSTVEYVAILVAGVLLATILYQVFLTDGKQSIQSALARILSLDRLTIGSSPPQENEGSPPDLNQPTGSGTKGDLSEGGYTLNNLPARGENSPQPQEPGPSPNQTKPLTQVSQESKPTSKQEKEIRQLCKRLAENYPAISYQNCVEDATNKERQTKSKESAETALDIILDNLPFIGNGKSIYEAGSGKNIFGEELSELEQSLATIGIALPWTKNLRHFKHGKKLLQFFGLGEDSLKQESKAKGGTKAGSDSSSSSGSGGKGDKNGDGKNNGKPGNTHSERIAKDVAKNLGGTVKPAKGQGWIINVPHGNKRFVIRVMDKGSGGRSKPYFRISLVNKKGTAKPLNRDGKFSSDRAETHIDYTTGKNEAEQIKEVIEKFKRQQNQ